MVKFEDLLKKNQHNNLEKAFNTLKSNLLLNIHEKPKLVLAITSAKDGEGKSFITVNLANAFARNYTTLLIDGNFNNPIVDGDEPSSRGFYDLMDEDSDPLNFVETTPVERMSILKCGTPGKNVSFMLSSPSIGRHFDAFRREFDIILIDTPSVLSFAEISLLSKSIDGFIMVVKCGETRQDVLRRAVDLLNRRDDQLLGVVLNQMHYHIPDFIYKRL